MSDRKLTPEETLAALAERAEAERVIDEVAAMTDEDVDRELAEGGVDVAKIEARARQDVLRLRRARRAQWLRSPAFGLAVAAVLLLAIGLVWRGRDEDVPVSSPPDAGNTTVAPPPANDAGVPSAIPPDGSVVPPASGRPSPP